MQDIVHRLFTAVANGTATITATAADGSGKKANCKVTVKIAGDGAGNGGGNTSTECQHNWVKQEEVKPVVACSCGEIFDTVDEWRAHNFEKATSGETNGHSCTSTTITTTKYVCSICGAEKE